MNAKERTYAVVRRHEAADRVPWTLNFGAYQCLPNPYLKAYRESRGITGTLYEYLDYDVFNVFAPEVTGEGEAGGIACLSNGMDPAKYYTREELSKPGASVDAFCQLFIRHPGFIEVKGPLEHAATLEEIKAYRFPQVDPESVKAAKAEIDRFHAMGKPVSADCGGLFGAVWYLLGLENFMCDLYEEPEFIEVLAEGMTELLIRRVTETARAGADLICFADDLGMQHTPQVDPRIWRKFFKPRWARVFEAARRVNPDVMLFMHSCGYVLDFIPDFIDIGLDALHPIQPEAMDVYEVARRYGKDLCLWGTISMQRTMPYGTPADVDREVRERVERIGRKGSFVLSPSNVFTADVPFENLDALIAACRRYCG